MKHYVGLDVSMKDTFVCIVDERGKILLEEEVKTHPSVISETIKKLQIDIELIGLESGSISHWLVDELKKLDLPTICIDARKMAAILSVQINKTDKNDARGIANAMRCGLYSEVTQKSEKAIEVATLMGSRKLLVEEKVQLTNGIRGLLKTYGIRLERTTDASFAAKVRKILTKVPPIARRALDVLLNQYEGLYENLKKLTTQAVELAKEDEDVKRLTTIPGVGIITAMTYRAEIDDPARFKNSRSVGAYLGMTPKQYSSGETKRQGRISKCGSNEVRSLLNESATVLLTRSKKWSKLRAWGLKIQRKHGFKKACMAVGRKLAVIMHRMWIDKRDFIYGEPKESNGLNSDKVDSQVSVPSAMTSNEDKQNLEEECLVECSAWTM